MALGTSPPSAGDGAYSSKLLDTLRLVVRSGGGASSSSSGGREVAARGQSRWSRAILARQRRRRRRSRPGTSLLVSKTRALGRLVLGCRRLSLLPALLAEVSDDYIAALQMQVRAMNRLTQGIEEVGGGVIIHIFKN
ncbi:transcription factor bHLH150-like [Setaria italica]|nr:transcription factor bHLH150-like [Setaria italica]